jgi:hypothetical protein
MVEGIVCSLSCCQRGKEREGGLFLRVYSLENTAEDHNVQQLPDSVSGYGDSSQHNGLIDKL